MKRFALVTAVVLASCSSVSAPDPLLKQSAQSTEWVDPSVPQDDLTQLRDATGDRDEAVKVLYPLGSAMLARNMGQVQFQWNDSGGKAFRVRAKSDALDKSFYVPAAACDKNECSFSPIGSEWLAVTQAASGGTVALVVYALNGSTVHASDTMIVTVSPEDVKGSLYYFSSSLQGVVRLPFGATAPSFFEGVGSADAPVSTDCVGCHAVSHDGKKFAGVVGGGDGFLELFDTSTATPTATLPPDVGVHSNFNSFNADGSLIVANWAGALFIIDATNGQTITTFSEGQLGGRAVMPEWSPDGTKIVFVRIPAGGGLFPDVADPQYAGVIQAGDWLIDNAGEIVTVTIDKNNLLGAPQLIVPIGTGEYHYYPSWSPDSQWIVFDTGSITGADSPIALASYAEGGYGIPSGSVVSYDQRTSRLRLVRASGGVPIELTRANRGSGLTNAWPKFAPFQQADGRYVFITFSSKADYGFVVTGNDRPQIWMAGIDLSLAGQIASGTASKSVAADPSFAPFWLPFQDSSTNNHTTIWTEQIECATNSDCGTGATCVNGLCEGIVQ